MARPRLSPEKLLDSLRLRLAERSQYDESTGCTLYIGFRTKKGYGKLSIGKRKLRAHRAAAFVAGLLPSLDSPLLVRHKCDNPPCIDDKHLLVGSAQNNSNDMVERGRQGKPELCVKRGEKNGNSKLTEALVKEIRASQETSKLIAARIGVTPALVNMVRRGQIWRHVA